MRALAEQLQIRVLRFWLCGSCWLVFFLWGSKFLQDVADSLFRALCGHAPLGASVFLDTPEPNSAALDPAKRHHMHPVFETLRIYNQGRTTPTDGRNPRRNELRAGIESSHVSAARPGRTSPATAHPLLASSSPLAPL